MKGIITLITVVLSFSSVIGQKQRLKLADAYYQVESYFNAAETYEDVLERGIDSATVAYKIGHSYFAIRNTKKAYHWHDYMSRTDLHDSISFARYINLSMSFKSFVAIEKMVDEATQKFSNNSYFNYLKKSISELATSVLPPDFFQLKHLDDVNTSESDFGVAYYRDNKVLVTSSKRLEKSINRKDARTGEFFFNLYEATLNEEELGEMTFEKTPLKSKFHDGPACYDSINDYVYFTRNNIDGNKAVDEHKKVTHLKIMRGKLVNGTLENVQSLPFNNDLFSTMHPSVSADGKYLFFSSNMPGGYGGFDLYMVEINKQGMYGSPINLGAKINTPLDDAFPFIQNNGNVMFFSSYGHYGKGGLDIFYAELSDELEPLAIFNCGESLNSKEDDFSFVNNKRQSAGFIASNRSGKETKDDIYSFMQRKPLKTLTYWLAGEIRDKDSEALLSDVSIELVDDKGTVIFSGISDAEGSYKTSVLKNIRKGDSLKYSIKLAKKDYVTQKFPLSVLAEEKQEIFVNNFIQTNLKKIELGETDLADVANINPIYFDFDKSNIRPDAAIELDKIVEILVDNPGMIIELGSHTDARGEPNYNLKLSNRRAKSSVAYIVSKGIERYRIFGTGYGELIPRISEDEIEQAKNDEESEKLHQLNRRTEFIIMESGEKKYTSSNKPPEYTDPSRLANAKKVASQRASERMQIKDELGKNVSGKEYNAENIKNGFYRVLPHETLYRIYVNTGVKVEDLKKINNIKDNHIEPGQKILLR